MRQQFGVASVCRVEFAVRRLQLAVRSFTLRRGQCCISISKRPRTLPLAMRLDALTRESHFHLPGNHADHSPFKLR